MNCSACGHENPGQAKFCLECGVAFTLRCGSCGTQLPSGAKFCLECGATLGAAAAPPAERAPKDYTPKHLAEKILRSKSALEGERKQVTVLFADVKGSMDLSEQLDPEEWHGILDRVLTILTEGVHRFEGTVNQYTGDGIMALFGAPIAHEDHAQRACYAALALRDELSACAREVKREHGLGLATRVGLHSGEVVVGKIGDDLRMDYTAQGHTVGLAQRMESLAEPNTCYLTETTAKLVSGYFDLEDLGPFRIKGVSEPVTVFELSGMGQLQTRFDVSRARGLSRFVGRDADMQTLDAALAQADAGNGQVIGIVAEAGTGKSRLCFEFLERCRASGLDVQVGRAVAHGRNIPFLPMLEVFRSSFGIGATDADQLVREKIAGRLLLIDESFREFLPVVFEFFGAPDPQRPPPKMDPEAKQQQLFTVLRKAVQEGDRRPISLIEDLHWLDPGSEAFLEQWVDAVAGSSNFVMVNFRPEFAAEWMSKSYYRQIPLAPLGPAAVRELLDDLIGTDETTQGLAEAIHERTGGNPFFTEEVVQSLIESGHLEGERGSYRLVTPVERLKVPANVQALLAARIDQLADREKSLLQTAAVIGKDFAEPILAAACGEPAEALRDSLRALTEAEFAYEQSLYPVREYAFKHPLTQEVALNSQLTERRRRTHAAVARALEEANGEHLDETAALLAHHWEEAAENAAATHWHARAARWAGTNDVNAALNHWRRVHALSREVETDQATELAVEACSQMLALGWRTGVSEEECASLFEEGCALAERAGDLASLASLNGNYSAIRGLNADDMQDYVRFAAEGVRIADRTGDAGLRCGTRAYLLYARSFAGDLKGATLTSEEVLEIADGDPHLGADVAGYSPLIAATYVRERGRAYTSDPSDLAEALRVAKQLALDHGYPEMVLWILYQQSEFASLRGEREGAEARAREANRLAENQGASHAIFARLNTCFALAAARDWEALQDASRETLTQMKETRVLRICDAQVLDLLARAQLALGRPEEARATAAGSVERIAAGSNLWLPGYALFARAQIELGEAAPEIERTLAGYADVVERTDFRIVEGELFEVRARLAAREGDATRQAEAVARARVLYAQFGATERAEGLRELDS